VSKTKEKSLQISIVPSQCCNIWVCATNTVHYLLQLSFLSHFHPILSHFYYCCCFFLKMSSPGSLQTTVDL